MKHKKWKRIYSQKHKKNRRNSKIRSWLRKNACSEHTPERFQFWGRWASLACKLLLRSHWSQFQGMWALNSEADGQLESQSWSLPGKAHWLLAAAACSSACNEDKCWWWKEHGVTQNKEVTKKNWLLVKAACSSACNEDSLNLCIPGHSLESTFDWWNECENQINFRKGSNKEKWGRTKKKGRKKKERKVAWLWHQQLLPRLQSLAGISFQRSPENDFRSVFRDLCCWWYHN